MDQLLITSLICGGLIVIGLLGFLAIMVIWMFMPVHQKREKNQKKELMQGLD